MHSPERVATKLCKRSYQKGKRCPSQAESGQACYHCDMPSYFHSYSLAAALLYAALVGVPASADSCGIATIVAEHEGAKELDPTRRDYEAFRDKASRELAAEKVHSPASLTRVLKELKSLEHQDSLIERTRKPLQRVVSFVSKNLGARAARYLENNFQKAVADSDKGKLKAYQEITWDASTPEAKLRSDVFLDLITLRPTDHPTLKAAQEVLGEILVADFSGRPGEGILHPRYSNDAIRSIVQKNVFLRGALHDLPGVYDAYVEFAATKDRQQFAERVRINFSHNGPGRQANFSGGFWGGLFRILVPGQLASNGEKDFFKETIYSQKDGTVRYPEGSSPGWFVHTASDRLQGSVNLLKFMAEAPDAEIINTFATSYDSKGVLAQHDQLSARLSEVAPKLANLELVKYLENYITEVRGAQETYAKALGERLKFSTPTPPADKIDSFVVSDKSGKRIAEYRIDRDHGNALTRDGQSISREELEINMVKDLFEPLDALDPLRL